MKLPGKPHSRYVQTHNDGMNLEQGQLCTIEELKEFARELWLNGYNTGYDVCDAIEASECTCAEQDKLFEDFWQELEK